MDDLIPSKFEIPSELRQAAKEGKLVPFIGAGASRVAGCPGWPEFADGALHSMIGQGVFTHGKLAQISHLNPRVKLSIALGLQSEVHRIDFAAMLHPKENAPSPKGIKLYSAISKLANSFVTTNYDRWLDADHSKPPVSIKATDSNVSPEALPSQRRVLHRITDLTLANLNEPNTVIHLHGTVENPDQMILTTQHYVRHYANDRGLNTPENRVLTFLDDLFNQKTVLFIGYGLEELEILEYVISNTRSRPAMQKLPKHFLIHGFFRHEYELMRSLQTYYLNECGIELLPYPRDEKNWDELVDMMEYLASEIPASPLLMSQKAKEMKSLLYDKS